MSVQDKLCTASEFEAFLARPENQERRFELVYGEILEKVPTQFHAHLVALLVSALVAYLRQNPIGWALVEAPYELPGDEHNARVPDVSFVRREGRTLLEEGAAPYLPDLAVEVQSPGQSDKLMADKAAYYLGNGARMVWLVYPKKRLIEVLTATDRQLLTQDDTLGGGDALPGFTLAVRALFEEA